MIQITGGRFVRRRIQVPKGDRVRPTPSRARAALFDVARHLPGAPSHWGCFLDCFAGSGVMGLEALSRGTQTLVLVEKYRSACQVIQNNIESLGVKEQCRLLPMDVRKALSACHRRGLQFDAIYIDPPYRETTLRMQVMTLIQHLGLLAPGGTVMVEYQTRYELPPDALQDLSLKEKRHWGETWVNFYGK